MKKLVLLLILILAFALNQNEIKAQCIVTPIEDLIGIIDLNSADIVLENKTTGEIFQFATAQEFYNASNILPAGSYDLGYTLKGQRNRIKIKIKNKNNL